MPTLSVAYSSSKGTFTVTGGDSNGADVTIPYGLNNGIVWNRSGTNFKFTGLSITPADGSFTSQVVTDAQMSVIDNDTNTSGKDVQYKYSITILDLSSNQTKVLDPKVINKSSGTTSLLTPMARRTVRKAKRATRARR